MKIPRIALGVFAGLGLTGTASAYCRTTTCDPTVDAEECLPDAQGCLQKGELLYWKEACATFSVQQDGSPKRSITYDAANAAATRAFASWTNADCSGELPSIGIVPTGAVECREPEYNGRRVVDGKVVPPGPNANIIVFHDETWPYANASRVIALTTITFDPDTGQIFDADIEVNTYGIKVTTTDESGEVGSDLESVLAHEVGHFFGLAHSEVPEATLNANYDRGDIGLRTLSPDDEAGICAIYPPDPEFPSECPADTQPRHGFSPACGDTGSGCSTLPGSVPSSPLFPLAALGALCGAGILRRRAVLQRT